MSNIHLKVTTEKNWRSQNSDFVSWGDPTQADIIDF